jgi:hypothetical protein
MFGTPFLMLAENDDAPPYLIAFTRGYQPGSGSRVRQGAASGKNGADAPQPGSDAIPSGSGRQPPPLAIEKARSRSLILAWALLFSLLPDHNATVSADQDWPVARKIIRKK